MSSALTPPQEILVSITYAGVPADGLIISKNLYGDRTFFGDNWPDRARHWLPCMDHPYEKASVEFIVTAPPQYEVIANGLRKEESYLNARQKLTHWLEEVPLPTKVMVIGVARFASRNEGYVGRIPVESWVYPQNRTEGFNDYHPAVQVLNFFNQHIGPYAYTKLANVQSTTRYGGMENANTIFYYEKSVTGKGEVEDLIAHEVAHQWFGNAATEADWHHVWLSEGFATYFTHVYNEFTYGKEKATAELAQDRQTVIRHCQRSPAPVIDTRITEYSKLLSPHVYQRGGWVLHMLRQVVGEDAFWKGIRSYYNQYKNSNALTADFQRHMEEASGKNLSEFFRQWTETETLPTLQVKWTYQEPARELTIAVDQMQSGPVFNIPLEIGISLPNRAPAIETFQINQKKQKITIPCGVRPSKIDLDPQVKLLFDGKIAN
jgi:aminopeptidase N